jgi:hypothetical protein
VSFGANIVVGTGITVTTGGIHVAAGPTQLDSTLTVTGATTLTGFATLSNGLTVSSGATTLGGQLSATASLAGDYVAKFRQANASGYGVYIWTASDSLEALRISNAAGTANPIQLFGSGNAAFAGNQTIGGTLSVTGTATLSGGLSIGGAVTFGPDNTYDIGASLANRPRNVYVAGTLTISGATSLGTSVSIGSTLSVTGATTLSGALSVATDFAHKGSNAGFFNTTPRAKAGLTYPTGYTLGAFESAVLQILSNYGLLAYNQSGASWIVS